MGLCDHDHGSQRVGWGETLNLEYYICIKKYVYIHILYLVLFGVTQTQRWDPSPRFLGMRPGGGNLNAVMVWVTGILGGWHIQFFPPPSPPPLFSHIGHKLHNFPEPKKKLWGNRLSSLGWLDFRRGPEQLFGLGMGHQSERWKSWQDAPFVGTSVKNQRERLWTVIIALGFSGVMIKTGG